jgi:WD40-like Beta Propeller Repeat
VTEYRSVLERAGTSAPPPDLPLERVLQRRDRRHRDQRIRAAVLGIAIAIAVGWLGVNAIRSTPQPADDRSEKFGIFAPVAGRILFEDDRGVRAVDPNGPVDTTPGPQVADDIASTLVPLDLKGGKPLGWSSDGTELLIERSGGDPLLPQSSFYILHADGSETRLNKDPMSVPEFPAAISPDGSRVAYSADGLWVVDADGGHPVRISLEGEAPTFSPDGTQVAYLLEGQVWVVDVDGSHAHQIHAYDENGRFGAGVTGLQWSPAGGRIALGLGAAKTSDALAIYTFAPDGSDFTRMITGGQSPSWSPDGSRIAYTIPCEEQPTASCPEGSILRSQYEAQPRLFGGGSAGLAIADADGSNVREFGYGASGPWHPGSGG